MTKKTYLVTGCFGFIGFHLCKTLLDQGHDVVGVDKGLSFALDHMFERAQILMSRAYQDKFSYYDFDLSGTKRPKLVADAKKYDTTENHIWLKKQYDAVFHLAASTGVAQSKDSPREYFNNNVLAMQYVLEKCQMARVKKLIYASSSSVYGEDCETMDAQVSYYAGTKRACEALAQGFQTHCAPEMQIIGCRFFTVYGPYGRPDMAPMKIAKALVNKEKIYIAANLIYDENDNRLVPDCVVSRDFTYIDDVIRALLSLVNLNIGTQHLVFDIGSENKIPLNSFAVILSCYLNERLEIKWTQRSRSDVIDTLADMNLYRSYLGPLKMTSIDQGLKLFTDWFKTRELKNG